MYLPESDSSPKIEPLWICETLCIQIHTLNLFRSLGVWVHICISIATCDIYKHIFVCVSRIFFHLSIYVGMLSKKIHITEKQMFLWIYWNKGMDLLPYLLKGGTILTDFRKLDQPCIPRISSIWSYLSFYVHG